MVIQGEPKNIELMLKFVSEGPSFSRVMDITVETIEAELFDDFLVKY